jgi:hypothetical protein
VPININQIQDLIVSHAMSTGYFQYVNEYESKQAGTNGITAGIWIERLTPIKSSGLSNTSVRLELQMRIYASTYTEPYDDIDANLLIATDAFFTDLIGDFQLGGEARHIDIFGAHGRPLEADVGWMNLDGKEFRVFQIRIPVIIDDIWSQSP